MFQMHYTLLRGAKYYAPCIRKTQALGMLSWVLKFKMTLLFLHPVIWVLVRHRQRFIFKAARRHPMRLTAPQPCKTFQSLPLPVTDALASSSLLA